MRRLFFNKLSPPVYGFLLLLILGSPAQAASKISFFYKPFDNESYERHLALETDFSNDDDKDPAVLSVIDADGYAQPEAIVLLLHKHNTDQKDLCLTHAIRGPPNSRHTWCERLD